MGLIQTLEDRAIAALQHLLEPLFRPIERLFNAVKSFFEPFIHLVPETISLFHMILDEISAWKNFKEDINFKTGVINLQSVRDRIEQLISEVVNAWNALIGLWKGAKLNPLEQINEAAASLADVIEEFGKIGRFGEFLRGIGPKIEKVGGKVFEVLAILQQVAETLLDVVRKLATILTAIKDVRETFQKGTGLFLSQSNKRKVLTLEDGSKIKIRLGKLHQ